MTDCDFVLAELRCGPRCAMDIIGASIRERGTGLTCHSRVAELRERGYGITCAIEGKTRAGRDKYVYRLVSEPSPSVGTVVVPATGGEVSPASLGAPVLGGVVVEQVSREAVAPSATEYEQLVIA